jgi:hypothetical protein
MGHQYKTLPVVEIYDFHFFLLELPSRLRIQLVDCYKLQHIVLVGGFVPQKWDIFVFHNFSKFQNFFLPLESAQKTTQFSILKF